MSGETQYFTLMGLFLAASAAYVLIAKANAAERARVAEAEARQNTEACLGWVRHALTDQRVAVLAVERRNCRKPNKFGDVDEVAAGDAWGAELVEFLRFYVLPQLAPYTPKPDDIAAMFGEINERCNAFDAASRPAAERFKQVVTGVDYEMFLLELLRAEGWIVSTTPATGDQGVDLLACRDGVRLAVQAKHYTSPVGNKAVQEVAAGAIHYAATHSAVVTGAGFTPAARSLAASTGVFLLHHDEIGRLAEMVGLQPVEKAPEMSRGDRLVNAMFDNAIAEKVEPKPISSYSTNETAALAADLERLKAALK